MKGSANLFPHLFLLLQTSHLAAADASAVRIYWKDGSLYSRDEGGTIVLIGPMAGTGGGVEAFTELSDVPSNYGSDGLKIVRVKADESALEFTDSPVFNTFDSSTGNVQDLNVGTLTGLQASFTVYTGLPEFVGCGALTDGIDGILPAPGAGNHQKFLRGDGSWSHTNSGIWNASGAVQYRRQMVQFIAGSNVTISLNDNAIDDRVEVTISASAAGSTTPTLMVSHSTAYEASRVLKSTSGNLRMVYGYNAGPDQYIQLHDASAVPADAVAPFSVIKVDSSRPFSIALDSPGIPFSTGIVVCNSTTGPTKTVGGANCYYTGISD